MKLVLMRHAEAVEVAENGERPLTAKGHRDAEKMAQLLRRSGWDWMEIRSSPVLRARQTAEHMEAHIHAPHRVDPALQPGLIPEEFLESFDDVYHSAALLCIFHMPDISAVASRLLGLDTAQLFFSPGSAIAMNVSGRVSTGSILIFHYQPDLIG